MRNALLALLPAWGAWAAWALLVFLTGESEGRATQQAEALRLAQAVGPLFAGEANGIEALRTRLTAVARAANLRLTLLTAEGAVIADTAVAAEVVHDNLADRPEIRDALATGSGVAFRRVGSTRQERALAAVRLPGGDRLLRVASAAISGGKGAPLLLAGIGLALLGLIGSVLVARRLSAPLRRLLSETRESGGQTGRGTDEVVELAATFHGMTTRLEGAVARAQGEAEQLQAVLHGMKEGVIAIEAGERISFLNGAARAILGVPEGRIVEGTPLYEWIRDPRLLGVVRAAGTARSPLSVEMIQEAPPRRTLDLQATPVGEGAGDLILVVRDLSPLRRLERMRSDFVSNVSHELRTPLASIAVAVETLEDAEVRRDDETATRFLDMIARNLRRLQALLNDILALSKLETQPDIPERTACDLTALCRATVEEMGERARAGGILLSIEAPARIVIDGDADALRRIVDNLVLNAITYTPAGGSVVLELAEAGESVVLRVRDTGIGIPAEERDRIFERFYRVDKARSRSAGGTGLGLAIVKHAVKVHGGEVHLESRTGEGSTFTVTLPRTRPPNRSREESESNKEQA